jgi:hypothetical protein
VQGWTSQEVLGKVPLEAVFMVKAKAKMQLLLLQISSLIFFSKLHITMLQIVIFIIDRSQVPLIITWTIGTIKLKTEILKINTCNENLKNFSFIGYSKSFLESTMMAFEGMMVFIKLKCFKSELVNLLSCD